MRFRINAPILCLIALLVPTGVPADEIPARSILFLHPSEARGPFYYQIFSDFRAVVNADKHPHTTLYVEGLDLSRFYGSAYETALHQHFEEKYKERPIGIIVAVGAATLERVLRWRDKLWPGIPVVFSMVDETDPARQNLPAGVTGSTVRIALADSITAARAVVPGLDNVVLVGDAWDSQIVYRNWSREKSDVGEGLKITELVGLPMKETLKRVESLPERSAVVYSATYSDGEGAYYPPATALALIAEKANRPIVVSSETFLTPGGIGGFVLKPGTIGADAARLALRILDGEPPSAIPVTTTEAVKPVFNWLQMQRWGVKQSDLPPGSEIRFQPASMWQKYWWQSTTLAAIILLQAGFISILLNERRKRSFAEVEARHRMTELAHVNRQATAGELSSSIAHELNQPLAAILTNTETAELILNSSVPDMDEVKEILADIRRDDLRASEVLHRMRSFLKRAPFEAKDIDINDTMREVFDFLAIQASARNVALYLKASPEPMRVKGDPVQLQQVILNLIVNSMDAMASMPYGRTVIGRTEINGNSSTLISISDSGPGISPEKLNEVFDPFFTTKKQGMGIGLSIARTIVQAHKGRIWAENQSDGGAVFHLSLPLALS